MKENTKSFKLILIKFLLLYSLFAPIRIKNMFSFHVEGKLINNLVILLPIVYLINCLFSDSFIKKKHKTLILTLFTLVFYVLFTGYKVSYSSDYWYSVSILFLPILMMFLVGSLSQFNKIKLMNFLVFINIVYSVFVIVLVSNYAFFMNIAGNSTDNYRFYTQFRAGTMLGSSITVSYYMNLSLPLNIYFYKTSFSNVMKRIGIVSILLNVFTSILLLSRASFFTSVFILLASYTKNIKTFSERIKSNIKLIFVSSIPIYILTTRYDVSRLFTTISSSNDSLVTRFQSFKLAFYIFSLSPLLGSGMSKYFTKVYSNRIINVNGITGLVDPHNLYIQVLSELGLMGFLIFSIIFISLYKVLKKNSNELIKKTSIITLSAFLLTSFGGTHLLNEVSYNVIVWIYLGLFI